MLNLKLPYKDSKSKDTICKTILQINEKLPTQKKNGQRMRISTSYKRKYKYMKRYSASL